MENDFSRYYRHLPHWRQDGVVYFVTWRLKAGQTQLTPDERSVVAGAIRHFRGERYELLAFVVMDDHCHALVQPLDPYDLNDVLHSWKSFTMHELQRHYGLTGAVWLDETFDRIVRDEDEALEKAVYIARNPQKRWPESIGYEWVEPTEL